MAKQIARNSVQEGLEGEDPQTPTLLPSQVLRMFERLTTVVRLHIETSKYILEFPWEH